MKSFTAFLIEHLAKVGDQWALVSRKTGKPLQYFGKTKPSEEEFNKAERRVEFFKHQG
jgi:hypothetical protein